MPVIRAAIAEDIPQIIALANEVWAHTYTPILGEAQVRYMLDKMYSTEALTIQMNEGQQFLLLLDDAHLSVGFASYSELMDGIYKLNKLYVDTALHGQGFGKALLTDIIGRIKAAGATSLVLNVNRYNNARHFYERLGFNVSGEEDIDIGSGYFMNDFVMHRYI